MIGSKSIGSKLALVSALLLPIVVWQLGKQAVGSFQSYQDGKLLQRKNAAANNLIAGVYEILMERLATNNALLADQPAGADSLREIEKRRSVAVQKITAAFADLGEQDFPNKDALLGELKGAIDNANGYRTKADAAVKLAKAGRDADTVKNLFVSLSALSVTSQKVWAAVLANTSRYDPELARLANIRTLAWNLRDIAGLERSHISAAIPTKAPIPADKVAAIGEIRAQVGLLWRFTQMALKGDEHPAVVKGIQLAKDGYFGGFQPLADQMRKQSAEGTPFAMSQQQWVDATTPQLFTLLEIMYGAGEASEAHTAEAGSAALRSLMLSLALLGAVAGGLLIAGWVVTRLIVRPIKDLTLCMRTLAGGNVDAPVLGLGRADEIGEMASAVQVFKDNMIETQRLRAGQAETEQSRIRQRKEEMSRMADAFEGAVGNIVDAVSSTSTELEAAAGALTSTAERAQSLSGMVATASDSASTNVGSVASASEQMASSINEIGRQVQESARIASEAVLQAQRTNDRVNALSQAANRIGDVAEIISTIASQTNLLALNATIEAARAGEAGRGFAVVASEVKALADQTAKATGEIGLQISNIQSATQESVAAIGEISGTIGRISDISATIADAVEQQGAATREISRNVQQAASGTAQVASNITDVQRSAGETSSASSQVLSSARSLSTESNRLRSEVRKFLETVRAA